MLTEHSRDLPSAVDLAQLDLPARYETEEQDQRGVFARVAAVYGETRAGRDRDASAWFGGPS